MEQLGSTCRASSMRTIPARPPSNSTPTTSAAGDHSPGGEFDPVRMKAQYPGDPALYPFAMTSLRDEGVILFYHARLRADQSNRMTRSEMSEDGLMTKRLTRTRYKAPSTNTTKRYLKAQRLKQMEKRRPKPKKEE